MAVASQRSARVGLAVAVLLASQLAACDSIPLAQQVPAGSREWIIPVTNGSDRPAILQVAEDGANGAGQQMGTATPERVPPGATVEVRFIVPSGDRWAIFVNAGPTMGPLILARDVPQAATGKLPLAISIGRDGSPSVSAPGGPGWFGN